MIYVDSNVPMYLVGAEHPYKQRVIQLVPQLLSAREKLVTSAETFQEIVHRYLAIRDLQHLSAAYEALEAMVADEAADITKADVDAGRAIAGTYPGLSSRDALHVAMMRRLECPTVCLRSRLRVGACHQAHRLSGPIDQSGSIGTAVSGGVGSIGITMMPQARPQPLAEQPTAQR